VRKALDERTADLQRLQAEFQNYRRRVERDRITVKEIAIANLLTELLPVLDDIGRARDHGELVGGFKSVAESLETVAAKMGLQQFGKEGEPFDPTIHEALMHSYAPDSPRRRAWRFCSPGIASASAPSAPRGWPSPNRSRARRRSRPRTAPRPATTRTTALRRAEVEKNDRDTGKGARRG